MKTKKNKVKKQAFYWIGIPLTNKQIRLLKQSFAELYKLEMKTHISYKIIPDQLKDGLKFLNSIVKPEDLIVEIEGL